MLEFISKSEQQTLQIAKKFAKTISKPSIILLEGDLGAGKTHFVKGFALGFGSKNMVTSPTFTLMNIYQTKKMPIYHFDMYRISSFDEVQNLGFEEYFDRHLDGVTIVEWPQNVGDLTKLWNYKVTISKIGDFERKIQIEKREEQC